MSKVTVEAATAVLSECPDAMKFVDLKHIPIHEIRTSIGGNNARAKGVKNDGVQNFMRIMKKGRYRPYHYIPPVVVFIPKGDKRRLNDDGVDQYRYELVAGEHRLNAHLALGKPEFYAQVVEFVSMKGRSATYWRKKYQIEENLQENDEYVREYASQDDIVHTVNSLVDEQLTSQTVHAGLDDIIREVINSLNIVAKGAVTRLMSLVHRKRGNTSKVVQGITTYTKEKYIKSHINNTNKNPDYVLYQNFTAGGAEVEDYDMRGIIKVWNLIEDNPKSVKNIHIVAGTTKSDYLEVPEIREAKQSLFRDHANDIIHRVAFLMGTTVESIFALKRGNNYEKFCDIGNRIFWIPQLDGEDDIVKTTGSLIQIDTIEATSKKGVA